MAAAAEQLWLDVLPPVQPKARPAASRRRSAGATATATQLDLRVEAAPAAPVERPAAPPPLVSAVSRTPVPTFVEWLFGQGRRSGMIGELARAAGLDRSFPKRGGPDVARLHLCRVGAEGDAFVALEEAERAFDRLGTGLGA